MARAGAIPPSFRYGLSEPLNSGHVQGQNIAPMRILTMLPIALFALMLGASANAQDAPAPEQLTLPIVGRVSDAEGKLQGCTVKVFNGNELVGEQLTSKGGRFDMLLGLGQEYAIEFHKEGFLPKRVLVDTRADLPKDVMQIDPLMMEMSMLPASKYGGANTDDLDFPFAIIRYNKGAKAFVQDQDYTADMMRTNGALLLMSGRAGK